MTKRTGPTNEYLQSLIVELRKKSYEHKSPIWMRLAEELNRPTRQRRAVNLYAINKFTKDKETIVVPGKVLAVGELDHAVNVAAWAFSHGALEKIKKNGKVMSINELIKESPKGKGIRIIC